MGTELVASLHATAEIGGKKHPVDVDVQISPEFFFRLVFGMIDVGDVVDFIATELGFSLPDMEGTPFQAIYEETVSASLGYYPSGKGSSGKATIEGGLTFETPLSIEVFGVTICTVHGVLVDLVAGTFSFGGDIEFFGRRQIVEYPFPEPSPPTPPLIVFDYLGLGQRLALPNSQETDIGKLVERMAKDLAPFAGEQFPESILDYYDPNAGWIFGIDLSVRKTFRLQAIFNDPVLYGLALSISKAPAEGLRFEILYKKVSDDVGQFYAELTLPPTLRTLQFGAVSVTLPVIAVGIYTNGDFRLALGWPLGDRSMTIQVFPFTGSGGFYFAKLSSATDPALPPPPPDKVYDPALEFGIAFSIGLGKQLNVGILSASLSLSLFGVFEGKVAWLRVKSAAELEAGTGNGTLLTRISSPPPAAVEDGLSLTGPDYFWFRGTFGIVGVVQGSVDFVIVKASVSLVIQASATITFETGKDIVIVVAASVSVSVSIEIGGFSLFGIRISITISFSFHADLTQTFVIANSGGGAGELGATLRELAGVRPLRLRALPLAPSETTQTLPLVLAPQVSVTGGVPQFVVTLTISTLPDPTGSSPFERLVGALGEWVVWHYVEDSTHTPPPDPLQVSLDYDSLTAMLAALRAARGSAAGPVLQLDPGEDPLRLLDYHTIAAFLAANFDTSLTLQPESSSGDGSGSAAAALFPIPAEMELNYTGLEGWRSFSDYNARDANYRDCLQRYMAALLLVAAPASSGQGAALTDAAPPTMAMLVFEDYFRMLLESIVVELRTLVHRPGEDDGKPNEVTLAAGLTKLDLDQLAGSVSRYLQHGLRIPSAFGDVPEKDWWSLPLDGIFNLTGQQFPIVPPSGDPPPPYSVSIRASEGSWIVCSPPQLSVTLSDRAQLEALAHLQIDPAVVSSDASAVLRSRPRSFTLSTPTSWHRDADISMLYSLSNPLVRLASQPGEPINLEVQANEPESESAAPLVFQAATVVQLTLRRVRSSAPGNVSYSGSSTAFVPNIYEVGGADEANRQLLDALLEDPARLAEISAIDLCYLDVSKAEAAAAGSGIASVPLADTTVLIKTNLSTTSNPQSFAALQGSLAGDDDRYWAGLDDPTTFLRLLWECSIVNSGGFYLRYETAAGGDLPDGLFKSTSEVALTVVVRFGAPSAAPAPIDQSTSAVAVVSSANSAIYGRPSYRASGQPLLEWDAAVPAGCVGFEIVRRNPRHDGPPGWQTETANLFNLVQYRVVAGPGLATTNSPWGPPVGPGKENQGASAVAAARVAFAAGARDEPATWDYHQAVAAYRFSGDGHPYGLIGAATGVQFRIGDVFGNLLADSDQIPQLVVRPLYEDRLKAVGEWPGVHLSYRIEAGTDGAELQVTLDFDAKTITNGETRAQAAAAQSAYQVIVDQLTDPHGLAVAVATTLAPETSFTFSTDEPTVPLAERLADFAKAVLSYVTELAGGHPSVPPKPLELSFAVDATAQPKDIFELGVSLSIDRQHDLVDPQALKLNPATASVTSAAAAEIPADDGISGFAERFENAFAGSLKLALGASPSEARAGAVKGAGDSGSLWAVRLGPGGIEVKTTTPWCYYAPPPLYTSLLTGSWNVRSYATNWSGSDSDFTTALRTFADVDLDLWADNFLVAFDGLLAPQLAAPLAVVARDMPGVADGPPAPTLYDQLLANKQLIADRIAQTTTDVYADQQGGAIEQARAAFGQQLLISLASAYSVAAIAQVPLEVSTGAADRSDPANFYGVVVPAAVEGSNVGFSTAKIPLGDAPNSEQPTLTFLVTPADPTAQDVVARPLLYTISFIEHELASGSPGEYLESSWLKFVRTAGPDGNPDPRLQLALDNASIPIPYRRFPAPPTLADQAAVQPSGTSLSDVRQWTYSFTYQQQDVSQDAVWATTTYNKPPSTAAGPKAMISDAEERPLPSCLFEALARVEAEWAAVASHFDAIPAAIADPGRRTEAEAAIRRAAELVNGVAQTWNQPVVTSEASEALSGGLAPVITELWLHEEDSDQIPKTPLVTLRAYRREDGSWPELPAIGDFDGPSKIEHLTDYIEATYTSRQPATPLRTRRVGFAGNDVMLRQNGTVSVRIERNAELGDRKTNRAFVYETPEITPPNPIAPRNVLNAQVRLDQQFPATTLPAILGLFLADLFGVSGFARPLRPSAIRHPLGRLRWRAQWRAAAPDLGVRLMMQETRSAVLLADLGDSAVRASDAAVLASVQPFQLPVDTDPNDQTSYVCQLSARIADHYRAGNIRLDGGALLMNLTVFSSLAGGLGDRSTATANSLLPLLTLNQLEVALPDPFPQNWWGPAAGSTSNRRRARPG